MPIKKRNGTADERMSNLKIMRVPNNQVSNSMIQSEDRSTNGRRPNNIPKYTPKVKSGFSSEPES